jgi:hypothetical protein
VQHTCAARTNDPEFLPTPKIVVIALYIFVTRSERARERVK